MNKTVLFLLLIVQTSFSLLYSSEQLKQSYFKLSTSNGLIVSVYNAKENRIDYVYPHIFARIDSPRQVRPFVGNITLKSKEIPQKATYVQNTHVIETKYKEFSIFYTASFNNQDKVFYIVARGTKDKIKNLEFVAETTPESPVTGIDHLENSYEELPCLIAGNAITGTYMKHYKENIYEKYFLYSFTDDLHLDKEIVTKAIQKLKETKTSLIDDEVVYMRTLISNCRIPAEASEKEKNILEQAVSVLKMSQVSDKEIFPHSHGQIIASLRPGLWHMAWVRDGSYAIESMTRLGMYQEAKKALEFMLKAPANKYRNYVHTDGIDYGPNMDYQISLTAYYGNGEEEYSVDKDKGPNIEYDDFGIFLTTFMDYVNRNNDWDFYFKWNEVVTKKIADVIINVIDPKNDLIKADSGPWEHWLMMPRQYTFTSGVCTRGLALLAEAQKSKNLPYEKYEDASTRMQQSIMKNLLVDNKYFKGNVDVHKVTDYEYWDGGTFEIFANGLIKDKKLFNSHVEAYNQELTIPGDRLGYIRLPSADPYENQEWVFINLRIAYAQSLFDNKPVAYSLINYVTEQATLNNNVIPEMFSNKAQMSKVDPKHYQDEIWCNCVRKEGDQYIGMIPMVGYGSGAYAIALLAYYGY